MKTCIITIIKNEQSYLRQWIKYHINLGIGTFFIYEDFDSDSHDELCKDFTEVHLNSVSSLFDSEEDLNHIKEWKAQGHGLQKIFQIRAFKKARDLNQFDWIFIMDVDEYITCNNLQETMQQYSDYDAVVLYWQNYNANGLVYTPEFPYDLTEAYTEKCGFSNNDINWRIITKIAFNGHTYNYGFHNHHWPSDRSNWCFTDFTRDKSKICYDRIYIRHYITKSFEEYYWKIKIRGMCYSKHRNIDEFFVYNPEMQNNPEIKRLVNKLNTDE